MSSVGFIGLGVMGREMAAHLLRAGHEVRAHDTRPEAAEELARQGAVVARSIAAAAGARTSSSRCCPIPPT
jgi:3-hydroxyisobutyrate dehydrogenase-like beta-hydroxyacid dehydrogenase